MFIWFSSAAWRAGRAGAHVMARDSSGGTATMTRLQVTAPRPVCTTARELFWSIRVTAAFSATREPSWLARRSGTSCEPPTKRRSWAPSFVSELRSKVPGGGLVAGAGHVEDHEQERELAGVGSEARLGPAVEQGLDAVAVDRVAADVLAERHRVPLLGTRVCPGRVDVDLGGPLVELRLEHCRVGEDERVGRDRAVVGQPTERARGVVDALALDVLLEDRHLRARPPAR